MTDIPIRNDTSTP